MAVRRMDVDLGGWGTIRKVAGVIITVAIAALLAAWYVPVIEQTRSLQRGIDEKRLALRKQRELHRRYREELDALRHNPEAVERAIRENLRLAKPHETIYHFEPPPSAK